MRRLMVMVLAAALCVAADVHAALSAASAASEVSALPGKKELADAHAFLQNLLIEGDPLMLEAKLKPGQGVFNNNALHNRTAFDPSEVGNHSRRIMYRVRFNNRIGSN